jgi:hypothetical protein
MKVKEQLVFNCQWAQQLLPKAVIGGGKKSKIVKNHRGKLLYKKAAGSTTLYIIKQDTPLIFVSKLFY